MSRVLTHISMNLLMPMLLLFKFFNDNLVVSCVLNFPLQISFPVTLGLSFFKSSLYDCYGHLMEIR